MGLKAIDIDIYFSLKEYLFHSSNLNIDLFKYRYFKLILDEIE